MILRLHITVNCAAQLRVGQLILVISQFLSDLLQSIPSLVIIACSRVSLRIESHHALRIRLNLLIFRLRGSQLHLIVTTVHHRHHLSLSHEVSLIHQQALNLSCHTKSQIHLRCSFRSSRKGCGAHVILVLHGHHINNRSLLSGSLLRATCTHCHDGHCCQHSIFHANHTFIFRFIHTMLYIHLQMSIT